MHWHTLKSIYIFFFFLKRCIYGRESGYETKPLPTFFSLMLRLAPSVLLSIYLKKKKERRRRRRRGMSLWPYSHGIIYKERQRASGLIFYDLFIFLVFMEPCWRLEEVSTDE